MISILSFAAATLACAGTAVMSAADDGAVEQRLMALAEEDPALARALQDLTAAHQARSYTPEEFVENVEVEWMQFRVPSGGPAMIEIGASGRCSVGGGLGGRVMWTDTGTGLEGSLSYDATPKYIADKGLAIDVTIRENGKPPVTTEHFFEDLQAIIVVLRVEDDGTRHVARYLPALEPKAEVLDFANQLTMRLSSAVLIADGQYAGQFTVAGPVIGIVSSDAGMKFEFGMKPFNGAAPLGKTDGRTISFDFDGSSYRLISTEPITVTTSGNKFWRVYVRGEPSELGGSYGTHAYTYDSLIVQDALKDLMP